MFDYRGEGREDNPIAQFNGERLSLGDWTGVSGASAPTGIGLGTSLRLTLLTGFFHVRPGVLVGFRNRIPQIQGEVVEQNRRRAEHLVSSAKLSY